MSGERILVAMSGGVDSSVAAALLHERGAQVVGVTLHLWDAAGDQKVGRCCAPEDREDARRTCDALGVPHYVIDERESFRATVVDPFVRGYAAGSTPSPCVACNQHVKLGRLAQLADAMGCEQIATGHYARMEGGSLRRGADLRKDQSYFLFGVPDAILARLVFPVGGMDKPRVRDEGKRLGVPNWDKRDSQELCFVPDGDVAAFVEREGQRGAAGDIVDESGNALVGHQGLHHFTVGQRKGLGLGGGPPRYVLKVLPQSGDVVVGGEAGLYASGLVAEDARWIGTGRPSAVFDAEVQIRHHHAPAKATIELDADGGFVVRFAEPQRAIAKGQAAVVYAGDTVIGGGVIRGAIA